METKNYFEQTRKISGKMHAKRDKVKEPTKNEIFFFLVQRI